ncbi:MAG TPA: ABC transporter substrate-binding protein [Smithellaceae bacterium]|nr:ABC transporter substrate-binding protein [Smithellaceae bacterium]
MKESVGKRRWVLGALLLVWAVAFLFTPLGADARTIKIGILGPMNFVQGDHAWKGAQIALDEIKAAGGINVGGVKMPVELVKIDTNEIMSMSNATSAVEKAITRDKVDFLAGGCSSGAILAMQDVACDHKKIFLIAGSGSHPEITNRVGKNYERYKYFFRPSPINAINIVALVMEAMPDIAAKVRKDFGIEKVKCALLFEQAQWLDPQVPLFQKLLPQAGIEVTGVWRMSISALDVSAQLMSIKESGAHIILAMTSGPVAIPMYRQVGELEIPAFITGVNVEAEGAKFFQATGGYCQYGGVAVQGSNVAMSWRTLPFYEKFEKKYKERPTLTASIYNSILIIKEGIERAGSLDTEKVIAALEKTDFAGTQGRVRFDKNHDALYGPDGLTGCNVQWMPNGTMSTWWPNGWKGIKYEGVNELQFSPWMVKYWKENAGKK